MLTDFFDAWTWKKIIDVFHSLTWKQIAVLWGGCGATALFAAVCDAYSFSSQEAVERTVDFRIRGIIRLSIAVVLLCACVWAAIKIT